MSARANTGKRRYRVVQWATGNVGSRALRRAIEHPDLDLVGVWVHSADKVGRDAGELAGHRAHRRCRDQPHGGCARAQARLRAVYAARL